MNLALLVVVLTGFDGEIEPFRNIDSLLDQDWQVDEQGKFESVRKYEDRLLNYRTTWSRNRILSLKPDMNWQSGTAWVLERSESRVKYLGTIRGKPSKERMPAPRGGLSFAAWRGSYNVVMDKSSDDTLLLTISFSREYFGTWNKDHIQWRLDTSFVPNGVQVEVPVEGRRVPQSPVTLVVTRNYFVDESGEENKPSFLGTLFGTSKHDPVPITNFLKVGEVIKITDKDLYKAPSQLATNPPPHFKPRAVRAVSRDSVRTALSAPRTPTANE
jgi:hypothetical protein